VIELLYFPQTR